MTWYGQKDTDKLISDYFQSSHVGVCVEVGVSDGIKGSNTLHFERERGWRTLCIDPIPEHVEAARKIREYVWQGACGAHPSKEEFYIFDIGERNILSSLSGLKPDPKLLVSHGHLINKCYTINVSVDPLTSILMYANMPKHIDFISIDTEGTELDVLYGLGLEEELDFTVSLLVVENNHNEPEIEQYLNTCGWSKVERYFVNDFYMKEK